MGSHILGYVKTVSNSIGKKSFGSYCIKSQFLCGQHTVLLLKNTDKPRLSVKYFCKDYSLHRPCIAITSKHRNYSRFIIDQKNRPTSYRTFSTSSKHTKENSPSSSSDEKAQLTEDSGTTENDVGKQNKPQLSSPSIFQRFKSAYKEYGKVLVGVHVATSLVWYGAFFYAARSGIDVVPLLVKMGCGDTIIKPFQSTGAGNFAVAYLLYKVATPARYTVTIGGTQLTVRQLRYMGYMETPATEDSLRNLVKAGRTQMRDQVDKVKDKMDDVRDNVKDKMDDVRDNVKDKMDDVRDNVKDKMDDVRDNVKDRFGDMKENVKEGRTQVRGQMEKVKDKMEDVRGNVQDNLEDVKIPKKVKDLKETTMDRYDDLKEDVQGKIGKLKRSSSKK